MTAEEFSNALDATSGDSDTLSLYEVREFLAALGITVDPTP